MTLYYARFSGALPGGEQWNTGVHLSGSGDLGEATTAATDFANALWAGSGPTDGYNLVCNDLTTLDDIVVYTLNPSTHKATARAEVVGPGAGIGVGAGLPQEVAIVATLRAVTPGPAGRGRMYLPPPLATSTDVDSKLTTAIQTNTAQNVADGIQAALLDGFTAVLSSVGRADRSIVSVDVGNVFDAQRRRRNKLLEVRVSVPIV